jgi:hypothetical protein
MVGPDAAFPPAAHSSELTATILGTEPGAGEETRSFSGECCAITTIDAGVGDSSVDLSVCGPALLYCVEDICSVRCSVVDDCVATTSLVAAKLCSWRTGYKVRDCEGLIQE